MAVDSDSDSDKACGRSHSSGFAPLSLNPAFWYQADAGTYQTSGGAAAVLLGDPVGLLQDQSGNGRHMEQITAGFRPTLVPNRLNGLPCIRFDGIDDYLHHLLAAEFTGSEFTYYVLAYLPFAGGIFTSSMIVFDADVASDSNTIRSTNLQVQQGAGFNGTRAGINLSGPGVDILNSWFIYETVFDASGNRSFVNGTEYALVNNPALIGAFAADRLAMSCRWGANYSNFGAYDIVEAFGVYGALSAAQKTNMRQYLNDRAGGIY